LAVGPFRSVGHEPIGGAQIKNFFATVVALGCCFDSPAIADQTASPDAVEDAIRHIKSKSSFYVLLNEGFLDSGCGGASQVYRLLILRTFSGSEVIRVTSYPGDRVFLTHTVGKLGTVKTTVAEIDQEVFDRLKTVVNSTPFLSMDAWPGIWGVDANRYVFEWCSGTNYFAVDRERDDPEIGSVFEFLQQLVASE